MIFGSITACSLCLPFQQQTLPRPRPSSGHGTGEHQNDLRLLPTLGFFRGSGNGGHHLIVLPWSGAPNPSNSGPQLCISQSSGCQPLDQLRKPESRKTHPNLQIGERLILRIGELIAICKQFVLCTDETSRLLPWSLALHETRKWSMCKLGL